MKSVNETSPVFVDWITLAQHHPAGGLPVLTGGITVRYSAAGLPVFERNHATSFLGSHDTQVLVGCDGFSVLFSGNAGRLGRSDNVFGFGFAETFRRVNRVVVELGLPAFSFVRLGSVSAAAEEVGYERGLGRGARITRLDLTRNYSTGSEAAARRYIRWLSGQSVARMRKGSGGEDSVWWSNTRHMLKAYRKAEEMRVHDKSGDQHLIDWLDEQGVVRIEVELKRRLLDELGLSDVAKVTDEKLVSLFEEQIQPFRRFERQGESLVLDELPRGSRVYAQAWLTGGDVRTMCSRATLFRHARVLRSYGIDLFSVRDVVQFPQRVEVIELRPLVVPDWYQWEKEVA